jgi:hypothetical protein
MTLAVSRGLQHDKSVACHSTLIRPTASMVSRCSANHNLSSIYYCSITHEYSVQTIYMHKINLFTKTTNTHYKNKIKITLAISLIN